MSLMWLRSRGDPETLDACLSLTDSFVIETGSVWLCMAGSSQSRECAVCECERDWAGRRPNEHMDNPPTGGGRQQCDVGWKPGCAFLSVPAARDVFEITRLPAEAVERVEGLICRAVEERRSPRMFERVMASP